ncbi:MAG: haloacid dehalogenase [Chlorobium sp.]|uniref:haloacid dehalogenase n=1 Tax=Chlorobium sp. TaxID=1095 RepID=UPI0025BB5BC7|nr:haloacid dehalogenase [Chlorobium sp.]MCF8384087.1 haloacid dehalogenase [Chlorobium sp.]
MSIILLDIGNVIVDVDFQRFCRSVARDRESGAARIFDRYCTSELKSRFDRGLVAPFDYLGLIAGDPDTQPMPLRDLKTAWQDIFSPKPEAGDAVRRLRENHALWIMSDTDPLHVTFLFNSCPELKQAEQYWLSFEHGWLKREREAFLELLAAAGRAAGEFILIDDREDNCSCAETCGIRTLLFKNWPETLDRLNYL